MRISALIPSRGRPERLLAAISSLHTKASGEHDVRYVIGCDADDDETIRLAIDLMRNGHPVVPKIGARQPSLGGLVNTLAEKCPADVYCSLADDVEILTDGWDKVIADAWTAKPDGVWFWRSKTNVVFAIVSEKWRAAAGRIFTDYFPFWWDDIWLIEVLGFATGRYGGDTLDVWLADRAPGTHRMRDVQEWDDFFWSRRDERKAEARKIAERLGWPRVESFDGLDIGRNPEFDTAELEGRQGDRSPPTPEYLAALERARALMNQQKEAA